MKKILHVISQRPSDTGSGVYLQNLISNGYKNGMCQAIVYGQNHGDFIEIDISDDKEYKMEFETESIPFSVVGMSDVMPYRSSVFSSLSTDEKERLIELYTRYVKKAILDFKPDIVFCQHLWLITSVTKNIIDELKLKIPVYGFCHGTDLRQHSLSHMHKDDVISGCSKIDGVFALNKFQVDEIISKYNFDKSKIHVIGNGYNSKYFYEDNNKFALKSNKTRIIYAGKLSYSKGLLSLIEAFKLLDFDKFELYIAGSGHGYEYDQIRKLIDETTCVHYLGKLSQEKLGDEFRKSDVFVLPSFYEGLPLVIIEAIACGLKVVCTNINGISEWIYNYTDDRNVISFVDLPAMLSVDKPDENSLADFQLRIAKSIVKESMVAMNDFDYSFIHDLRWQEIFTKINRII